MPTYQYRCKECAHEFEVVQSFSDEPLESCPECEGRLKKVYGNVGISFKGSGFYKTDSRGSKKPTGGSSGSSSDSGDAKPSESTTKSETSSGTSSGSSAGDKKPSTSTSTSSSSGD